VSKLEPVLLLKTMTQSDSLRGSQTVVIEGGSVDRSLGLFYLQLEKALQSGH
jgi:hypothetical protein